MTLKIRIAFVLFMGFGWFLSNLSGIAAQEGSGDALSSAITWQELGANDPEAAEAFWNDLSSQEQAEVGALLEDVSFEGWVIKDSSRSSVSATCDHVIGYQSFYWAGGTIYGGSVTSSIDWCWDGSSYGVVTSVSCYPDHDQIFPWSFVGWARSCDITSSNQQHTAFQTEGIFSSTHGTSAYPCAGTTVDGYGNSGNYTC